MSVVAFGEVMLRLSPLDYRQRLGNTNAFAVNFAVGGINYENLIDWINAGVDGVGIGGSLLPEQIGSSTDLDAVQFRAKQFTQLLHTNERLNY